MRKILPILFVLSLALSPCAAAADSVSATLCMPAEYVNYTITSVNGTLWVDVEGTYPISFSDAGSSGVSPGTLLMVYPVPPETANVQITLNGTELDWDDYTQFYPAALHHTAVGDWRMINCTTSPVPDSFVLKIRYEHPLATVNGSHMFLYDLNISPYLSPQSPTSTAYFNIRTDVPTMNLQTYTTETDTVWNPINYTASNEGTTQVISVQMQSEYAKPLMGDLVVTFNTEETGQFPSLTFITLLTATIASAGVGSLVYFKKRRPKAVQSDLSKNFDP